MASEIRRDVLLEVSRKDLLMGSRKYAQGNNKVHSHNGSSAVGSENDWYKFEQAMEVHREETKKKDLKEFGNVLQRLVVLRQTVEEKRRQLGST